MRLDGMELDNFRLFEHFVIDFDERLTVMVGDNGCGKSSVLDAAAIALGTALMHVPGGNHGRSIARDDVRLLSDGSPRYPASITAFGRVRASRALRGAGVRSGAPRSDECATWPSVARGFDWESYACEMVPINWRRSLNRAGGRTTYGDAREMTAYSEHLRAVIERGEEYADDVLPLVSYYGTGRLWLQRNYLSGDVRHRGREAGYAGCLSAQSDERRLIEWLRRATLIELQVMQTGKPSSIPKVLAAVRAAVEECFVGVLEGERPHVYFDVEQDDLMIDYHSEAQGKRLISMSSMSDGYHAMLGMVADIAYRMAALNPSMGEDVLKTPGVVLIDEVDLHLHPKWQSRVLGDLLRVFPNVQFIVTTHAPSVIASVDRRHVRRLVDLMEASEPVGQTYGRDHSSLLREVMDADERPPEVSQQFAKIYDAIDREDTARATKLLDRLESQIGPDDPDIVSSRSYLALDSLTAEDDALLEALVREALESEGE